MKIRKAIAEDVDSLMEIKDQLSFETIEGETTKGGFLLGTDATTYLQYIQNDYCLVAENEGIVVGFGIMLKDETVRQSDIWQRRQIAQWEIDIEAFENRKIAYFDQLAFLHGYNRTVMRLAYQLLNLAFHEGHDCMFATTVHKPIINLAAVPYILKASGSKVGNINETYPLIGEINSDIYLIEKKNFEETVRTSNLFSFLTKV